MAIQGGIVSIAKRHMSWYAVAKEARAVSAMMGGGVLTKRREL